MRKKSLIVLGGVALTALMLTSCTGNAGGDGAIADDCEPRDSLSTTSEGVLTVALTNTPPYSIEGDGEISGIDGDIVKEFAASECLSVEYAPYTYATAIPAIEQSRADIALGGFYRTEARAEVVTLSAPLYLDELSIYANEKMSTVDDLDGLTIGTVEGYLWVDDLRNLKGVETRVYADSLALAQDLGAGRIDAALDGYGAATVAIEGKDFQIAVLEEDERVSSTEVPSQAAVLLDPANEELSTAFDSFVAELRENGRLVEILADYNLPASAADVGEARLIS